MVEHLHRTVGKTLAMAGVAAGDWVLEIGSNDGTTQKFLANRGLNLVATDPSSPQMAWLKADLAANPVKCTLAYWHHPLYSSGPNGNNDYMREMYRTLYAANADLLLVGHDHMYERFAPQNADGGVDTAKGMREFVVGTGGVPLYDFQPTKPNSEVRLKAHGIMKLTLSSDQYAWDFLPVSGAGDSGTQACH